ncbi:MAG: YicC/YloC family endoribonuclease [Desulfitobacteriaceae bacterium]|nr:YicC/YloC family endoribonuclease [Desulfitobacteriaceae bacterium]MDI6880722.1 YicC/YloC family endoribonuclease [Desulfitobacteriaceae bacterium]MDI6915702.1 YicC/YloC family endoribonuclease [Desulfitobacteriaceae bacterium]
MAVSMTGFGRGEVSKNGYKATVEIKAVNHRFLEVVARLPRTYVSLEDRVRKAVQEKVQRGRLEVYINTVETEEKKRLVKVDKDLALSYDKSLRDLALTLNAPYATDVYRLATLPEVLVIEEGAVDFEGIWEAWEKALTEALNDFTAMRRLEGQKLSLDLAERLQAVAREVSGIAERSEGLVPEYQMKLKERIQVLLGETVLDEARLANEVAYFADRASITEEWVRLNSHIQQSLAALQGAEPSGRKLDFLVQEMNREINTIGSKANDLNVSQAVIRVKSELEKIREQIQNLE